jgi:deoxyadenosine/deoxycytidine kinase
MKKYIVLAGNIGAGKSTLVSLLAASLGFRPYYEPVAENPYLEDFYNDMERWAFQSQVYFLTHRVKSHHMLMDDSCSVVQDRSLYEDANVFARNLFSRGAMSSRDWTTYSGLYRTMTSILPAPDLVVYIRASVATLKNRIARRGRGFEAEISDEYLENLNALYEEWIAGFTLAPVLVVPGDRLDFVEETGDLQAILKTIESRLRDKQGNLFPVGM